ncbi:uncharacterized protein At5g65660-like isoform X1 [Lycium ferocissimum]|uniref:uncharacterized protein At5g65660-like isoform X1 n=1 Tax=Lycium ferocissimum TaxID=112874 RepID=UPI002815F7BB|nr:uncharacterized protein At5g65660-like isoform X1 [Lycium ferocissimum]
MSSSSRPNLSFPLGLALLVLVLVCMIGIFSCCYHWDKLRSFLCYSTSAHDDQSSSDGSNVSASSKSIQGKEQKNGESLTIILMPGDDVPKFVALPTPRGCTLQLNALV